MDVDESFAAGGEDMFRVLCLLIGYGCGLFNTAIALGKFMHVDITKQGSGNAGTTNMMRIMGPKAGFTVLIGDMLKVILPIILVGHFLSRQNPEFLYLYKAWTGFGAVLGHNFPFYRHFKGGKGIATTSGFIIAFHPTLIPVNFIAFLVPFWLTHYVSFASLTLMVVMFVSIVFEGQVLHLYGSLGGHLPELYGLIFVMMLLAFWQHRGNIRKLLTGTERKTYIFKKNKVS